MPMRVAEGGPAALQTAQLPRQRHAHDITVKDEQRFDFFCQIFRIDGAQLHQDVVDRLSSVLKTLEERSCDKGTVIVEQGDAAAPHEMLLMITGKIEVLTNKAETQNHKHSHRRVSNTSSTSSGRSSKRMGGDSPSPNSRSTSVVQLSETPNTPTPNYSRSTSVVQLEENLEGVPPEPEESPPHLQSQSSSSSNFLLLQNSLPSARGRRSSLSSSSKFDQVRGDEKESSTTITAPFFLGEERVLRNSWPTATYVVQSDYCVAYVLQPDDVLALTATGGFSLERTLRLRSFERALAFRGVCTSVLRDAAFVEHFMTFLTKTHDVENLRFLVDLMKFKREVDVNNNASFDTAAAKFDALWAEYFQPWGPLANVAAIDCPSAMILKAKRAAAALKMERDASELATALDPIALRVKALLDTELLPAFISGLAYSAFLQARFPLVEEQAAQPQNNQLAKRMFKRIEGRSIAAGVMASHTAGAKTPRRSSKFKLRIGVRNITSAIARLSSNGNDTQRPSRPSFSPMSAREAAVAAAAELEEAASP